MKENQNCLLQHKKNIFSQNGEDGAIEAIFSKIGIKYYACCEFGAWDGIYLSNCRKLILEGWKAVMIEGDAGKYGELKKIYAKNDKVIPINAFVDIENNSVDRLLEKHNVQNLDFLSIDIDGLDYQIFENLAIKPRVICVEVNAGHSPKSKKLIPDDIAKNNVGQPFYVFCKAAENIMGGYSLVCYTGNAFFISKDCLKNESLKEITPELAYLEFLDNLNKDERTWLYWVNLAFVPPFYKYKNLYLTLKKLRLPFIKTFLATLHVLFRNKRQIIKKGKLSNS
jgi:hypothetical protein